MKVKPPAPARFALGPMGPIVSQSQCSPLVSGLSRRQKIKDFKKISTIATKNNCSKEHGPFKSIPYVYSVPIPIGCIVTSVIEYVLSCVFHVESFGVYSHVHHTFGKAVILCRSKN